MEEKKWYVVKTNIRAEKKVNERIINMGFETYLPLQEVVRVWSDRKKKVSVPLIASTLFVSSVQSELKIIYSVQGVSTILMYLKKPAIVLEHEINNMRILLEHEGVDLLEEKRAFLKGEAVQVIRGPFKGLVALATSTEQKFRVVVELESLGTCFSVNVPKSYVRKIVK